MRNITIINLSSLPFEVVSLIVSVVSRIAFDASFYNSKPTGKNETPLLLVYEKGHKYILRNNDARIPIQRIAKDGRKYDISEMIVSQGPSELSPTVLSQCNNYFVMKLTNAEDQNIVRSVLPDNVSYFPSSLSSLLKREVLLTGDAVNSPCVVGADDASPLPDSNDVDVYDKWLEE